MEPIDRLQKVVKDMDFSNSQFAMLMVIILRDGTWRKRYDAIAKQEVVFDTFEDFVRTKPFRGLGASVNLIKAQLEVIKNDKLMSTTDRKTASKAMILLNDALNEGVKPNHRPANKNKTNSNATSIETDRSSKYIQRRLRKDNSGKAKKLLNEIKQGKKTYSKANIEMGWKKPIMQIPKDKDAVVRHLKKNFTTAEIKYICSELMA